MCGCALLAYLGLWQLSGDQPRTVVFDIERWENNSWGVHNIELDQIRGTVAVSADGSRVNVLNATRYQHYLYRVGVFVEHSIYLKPSRIAYRIDDKSRTTTTVRCTCRWNDPPPRVTDWTCSAAAKSVLGN